MVDKDAGRDDEEDEGYVVYDEHGQIVWRARSQTHSTRIGKKLQDDLTWNCLARKLKKTTKTVGWAPSQHSIGARSVPDQCPISARSVPDGFFRYFRVLGKQKKGGEEKALFWILGNAHLPRKPIGH